MLEVAECNQDHSHIVHGSPQKRVLQDILNSHAALFMNVVDCWSARPLFLVVFDTVPYALDGVLVIQLVKYPVTANYYEVMLLG